MLIWMLGSTLILSSCATTEYVTPKITVNPQPDYPVVRSREYACMAVDAQKRLAKLVTEKNLYIEHLLEQIEPYRAGGK